MVRIRAPAHLHTGNPDLSGDMGRLYGTVGFAIERPFLEIEVTPAEKDSSNDEDAMRFLKRFRESYDFPPVEVIVKSHIPKWVGVGFHTTLALSLGKAVSELYNLNLSLEEIALAMRRGLVTALGFYAVKVGGFIYEGGFPVDRRERVVPPLIFRGNFRRTGSSSLQSLKRRGRPLSRSESGRTRYLGASRKCPLNWLTGFRG